MKLNNFTLVIFGGGGDLSKHMLLPAIYRLTQAKKMALHFRIIGVDLAHQTQHQYQQHVLKYLKKHIPKDKQNRLLSFIKKITYVQTENDYISLKKEILSHTKKEVCDNVIYYLATPPQAAPSIIQNLKKFQMSGKDPICKGAWRKVVIEKPYGSDLKRAKKLNALVKSAFDEHQIYRIDHFLAKETIQNILMFRFANGIFEPLWNRQYIDHVQIHVLEKSGIRDRGPSFEQAGLIRDMIQNHVLQLISVLALEPPASMEAERIRDEKSQVLYSMAYPTKQEMKKSIVIGQYNGYRKEKGVAPKSTVETFAALTFNIDNLRWKDVPFYVRAGKCLKENKTEVVIHFKNPPMSYFNHTDSETMANQLIIQIQPEEKIQLKFCAKRPGEGNQLDSVLMEFNYHDSFKEEGLQPYHRLLLDVIKGDQTRFIREDSEEESWKIIDHIRTYLKGKKPLPYKKGSWGPKEMCAILKENCHWHTSYE